MYYNTGNFFWHFWILIVIKITLKTTIIIMWQLLKLSFQDKLEYVEQLEWMGEGSSYGNEKQMCLWNVVKRHAIEKVKFFLISGRRIVLTCFPQFNNGVTFLKGVSNQITFLSLSLEKNSEMTKVSCILVYKLYTFQFFFNSSKLNPTLKNW